MDKVEGSDTHGAEPVDEQSLERERGELLQRLDDWLETPMLFLAFAWLALLVAELVRGESHLFTVLGMVIWAVFILDFAVKLVLAPHKIGYVKDNWLTAISLLVPALRIFRAFRVFRILRLARAARAYGCSASSAPSTGA